MTDTTEPVFITVIPPNATEAHSDGFFPSHRASKSDYDSYQSPSPGTSPGLSYEAGQSEGYPSSPDTPSDVFQQELSQQIMAAANSPFLDNLGLWPEQSTSPSSLSPAFNFLNLGDNGAHAEEFNALANDYNTLKVEQNQAIRTSLSPLTIPPSLNSPQPQYSAEDDFYAQFLTPDVESGGSSFDGTFADPSSSLSVPRVDGMALQQQQQQQQRHHHIRANSEINMPWSGSLSPSLVLTPSEPTNPPSFLLADPGVFEMTEDYTLAQSVNLIRRHSHTGVGGRGGFGRGRAVDRSAPSSRASSRGSSPYSRPVSMELSSAGPALGPTGMSISPTQIFGDEMNNHLTVPVASHFEGNHHARRHSFHLGARPEMFDMGPYMDMLPYGNGSDTGDAQSPLTPGSTPTTPNTPSRAVTQVASAAGISASERRRTKAAKFVCPTCPQTFTTNHNLKNHINAHLGVKKHQCEHCARAFTTASVLARHCKTCKSAPHHP